MSVSKLVLVTGCSSGIGKATALRLKRAGFDVVATARRVDSLGELAAAGCYPVALDLDDDASMVAAVEAVRQKHGVIGILVNNAGFSQSGAVESIPIDKVRRQFETNVFGLLRLIQLVAPGMRAQGWGRIVNVGSMGGRLTFPGGGVYHATKYALEALSDALRFELAGFGVDVVLLQPGLIKTNFADAVTKQMSDLDGVDGDPYARFNREVQAATTRAYTDGPLARLGGGPEDVAAAVERVLGQTRGPARLPVTGSARLMIGLRAWLPEWAWQAFLRSAFRAPGPG